MSLFSEAVKKRDFRNLKVTVMGLGLNGGGFASALFFASRGADVTATDLRSREVLLPTIEKLSSYDIRYVLGHHDHDDFRNADVVIKNPAVNPDSEYLRQDEVVETDISLFLRLSGNPLIAVTGSKGKSTTVSAVYHVLKKAYPGARLGGNITTSPLMFLDRLDEKDPVVLELSSWQLSDLAGKGLLRPEVAIITNILPDHLNRYQSMEHYVSDKKIIYEGQDKSYYTLCNHDDSWGKIFASETPAKPFFFSAHEIPHQKECAWLTGSGKGMIRHSGREEEILPEKIILKGNHNRTNMLAAGAALSLFGLESSLISEGLSAFPGIAHRMEYICSAHKIDFYNDTTATIPEALIAAAESFSTPVRLVSGGTDKNLDFSVLENLAGKAEKLYLLEGSATEKMIPFLDRYGIKWSGPFSTMEAATESAFSESGSGDSVVLSPGCTSFGMFNNEFERGESFRQAAKKIAEAHR